MSTSGPSPELGGAVHPGQPRRPLGTIIFQKGLLSAEQLLEALEEGHRSHRRLGDILIERGWLNEQELAAALAEQHGMPVVELGPGELDPAAAMLLSPVDAERLGAVVLRRDGNAVVVAVSDPPNSTVLAELDTLLGETRVVLATASSIAAARLGFVGNSNGASADAQHSDSTAEPLPAEADDLAPQDSVEAAGAVEAAGPSEPAPFDAAATYDPTVLDGEAVAPAQTAGELAGEQAAEAGWPPFEAVPAQTGAGSEEPDAQPMSEAGAGPEERPDAFLWSPPTDDAEPAAPPTHEPAAGAEAATAETQEFTPGVPAAEYVPLEDLRQNGSHPESSAEAEYAPVTAPGPSPEDTREAVPALEPLDSTEAVAASSEPFVLVLRLSNGEAVRLGPFEGVDAARTHADELFEQLRADESAGWTSIDGRYLRPHAIIALDVVPEAA